MMYDIEGPMHGRLFLPIFSSVLASGEKFRRTYKVWEEGKAPGLRDGVFQRRGPIGTL